MRQELGVITGNSDDQLCVLDVLRAKVEPRGGGGEEKAPCFRLRNPLGFTQ